ncbi:MAG: NrfD/PsrC family molybdoenzyme membrane anchor subunit [Bacillota bacterium]
MKTTWWRWQITPFKGILLALFLAAAVVAVIRLFTGLGAVTGMNDSMPWAIWKTIHVIIFVPLGASGFTLAFIRYFTPIGKKYEHIMRRAVIWAAIAYLSAGVSLAFDIGLPWRIANPLIFGGNLHSPLFEVAWCMALYIMVLFLENVPRVMERQNLQWVHKLEHTLHKIMPGFVLFGVLLSTMHQSSLGTIFMIVGKRMDPLWYHPWINYTFLTTAIAAGLSVAILIEGWSNKYYRTPFQTGLLAKFAPWIAGLLTVTLAWRLGSMVTEGTLGEIFVGRFETVLWWAEIIVGYLIPIFLFASPLRQQKAGLVTAAMMTVGGMILLRTNTAMTGLMDALNASYTPKAAEVIFSVGAIAGTLVIYTWFVETLPAILGRDEKDSKLQHAGD